MHTPTPQWSHMLTPAGHLTRMQAAEPYREQLRERGVSLLPLNSRAAEAEDPSERLRALKREFRCGCVLACADTCLCLCCMSRS